MTDTLSQPATTDAARPRRYRRWIVAVAALVIVAAGTWWQVSARTARFVAGGEFDPVPAGTQPCAPTPPGG